MLDLHKLSVFQRVISAGSFSKAAQDLLMTQSAVSQHIQDMERQIGVALFLRQARGAAPTEAGLRLAVYADDILRMTSAAELELTNIRESTARQLTIATTSGVGVYAVPRWVSRFQTAYPNIQTMVTTGLTHDVLADLERRTCDIAIIEAPGTASLSHKSMRTLPIGTSDHVLVVGPKHMFWGSSDLSLNLLKDALMITRESDSHTRLWLDGLLKREGYVPQVVATYDSIEAIKYALTNSPACALLPSYAIQNEVSSQSLWSIPLGPLFQRTVSVAHRSSDPLSPVSAAFIESLNLAGDRPLLS